jgi:hypothetical protein
MAIKFTNNATATLAASISTSSTSLTVTTSQGALFPTLGAGDYFYATLTDSSNNLEIVKITARAGDTLTAVRAQEGTTARIYAAADKLELRVTAAALSNFVDADGPNTFVDTNTFSGSISSSGSNTFSGANSFTGPAVAFTNVPTFGGGALPISNGGTGVTTLTALGNLFYPVGSIYINATVATNPGTLLGFGTWTAFGAGRVPVGFNAANALFDTAEETGGSADAIVVSHTHTLTDPGHNHNFNHAPAYWGIQGGGSTVDANRGPDNPGTTTTASTGISIASAGSSGTNANYQPYITVYMWKRTA